MTQATTCLYCGEPGSIVPLTYRPGVDMHGHVCGTNMLVERATGEVLDIRRYFWCKRWDALKAEMHALTVQVQDLIHQRDGDGDDLPF